MLLESDAFEDGSVIPRRYTCDGADASPPLRWRGVPPGTRSFALIMSDPDAPTGTWIHWVLFNVPTTVAELSEAASAEGALPKGIREGTNDWDQPGYRGPCPPRGAAHRYFVTLYALDAVLDLPVGASATTVAQSAERHLLGKCELVGRYQRA
jgi:Raf kinase inhibitor-like YbhB/YbcL family protein